MTLVVEFRHSLTTIGGTMNHQQRKIPIMKYICLSYLGPINWETMSESDRKASMEEFFAYEAEMRKNGHILGGEGLQSARNAATLRFQNGKVSVTDGPYAETKEQLAGFWVIE